MTATLGRLSATSGYRSKIYRSRRHPDDHCECRNRGARQKLIVPRVAVIQRPIIGHAVVLMSIDYPPRYFRRGKVASSPWWSSCLVQRVAAHCPSSRCLTSNTHVKRPFEIYRAHLVPGVLHHVATLCAPTSDDAEIIIFKLRQCLFYGFDDPNFVGFVDAREIANCTLNPRRCSTVARGLACAGLDMVKLVAFL